MGVQRPREHGPSNQPQGAEPTPGASASSPGSASSDPSPEERSDSSSVTDDAQQTVEQIVDQVRDPGVSLLERQKERVAETVGSVASALRGTSQQVKQGEEASAAPYLDWAAERVDQLSTHLRTHSVAALQVEVEGLARRQPALFLGGAFVLGLLGARILKSGRPDPRPAAPPA